MIFTVDRIEDQIAVLQDDTLFTMNIPLSLLPPQTKEGTILDFDGEKFNINDSEENAVRKKLYELQKKLQSK